MFTKGCIATPQKKLCLRAALGLASRLSLLDISEIVMLCGKRR